MSEQTKDNGYQLLGFLTLAPLGLVGPVLMIASYFLDSPPVMVLGIIASAAFYIFFAHLKEAQARVRRSMDQPHFHYVKPLTPGSLTWMSPLFYLEHPKHLTSQTACYLWRGHLMYRGFTNDEGRLVEYKKRYAEENPEDTSGDYHCQFCGQVMSIKKTGGDS